MTLTRNVNGVDVPLAPEEIAEFEAQLAAVNSIESKRTSRKAAVTSLRYAKETGGLTVGEVRVKTDRESQARLTGAWVRVQQAPTTLIDWKTENGWIQIGKETVEAMANAVGAYVQACFTRERAHHAALDALTTVADIAAYDITTGWPV